jgi:predicted phosphodiesterase
VPSPKREPTGEELELLRRHSDAEVARLAGVSRQTVARWRWEHGVPRPAQARGGFRFTPPPPPGEQAPSAVVSPPARSQPGRERESAVLLVSDIHYGKRTSTFGPQVARDRMSRLLPRLERIHQLLSASYQIDELVVALLGDVNDGSEIYPTQAHHQEISDPLRQAWEFAGFLAEWLRAAQRVFGAVRVEAVPGNHGRGGSKRIAEAANWDLACYHYLALHLAGTGIGVGYGEDDPFMRILEVRGHRFLLYHGHAIRMYQTIPWYGLMQRMLRWRTALGPFAALCCGHFHAFGEMDVNGTRLLLTGTLVTDDQWALQTLGLNSANRWHLFGVGDKRAITWRFDLDLI